MAGCLRRPAGNFSIFRGCGRSPDRATGGRGQETGPSHPKLLRRYTGSNQFGAVYGELYRKFGITSYKLLPAHRFEEAMKFLTEWYTTLTGEAPF
jgi:hypothetical protein